MNFFKKLASIFSGSGKYDPESISENGEMPENHGELLVYGTNWCYATKRAVAILDHNQIPYQYFDIDQDRKAGEYVESVNRGNRSVPTIVFPDGSLLVEPSDGELRRKLGVD